MKNKNLWALISCSFLLTACGGDNNEPQNTSNIEITNSAIVQSSLWEETPVSEVGVINLDSLEYDGGYLPQNSTDFVINTYEGHLYQIGRYNLDFLTKYSLEDLTYPIYQYSLKPTEQEPTVNPYSVIFKNSSKAYVLYLQNQSIWIINPSAESAEDFKIGEIDMSAYADQDDYAEMFDGVIVGDLLYIGMQRLDTTTDWEPRNTAYIAVIDTNSDTEIRTHNNEEEALNGIPLLLKNPQKMHWVENHGIYVQSIGSFSDTNEFAFTGGIELVDTEDFSSSIIIDDGTIDDHPYDRISDVAIVSSSTGFFVAYHQWQDNSLYQFNPSDLDSEPVLVEEFSNIAINEIKADGNGGLWLLDGDAEEPGIWVIDPSNSIEPYFIATEFPPSQVIFTK